MKIGIRYLKGTPPEIEFSLEWGRNLRKWKISIAKYFRFVTLRQYVSKGYMYQYWDKYQSKGAPGKGSKFHDSVSYKSYICTDKKTKDMS